MGKLNDEVTKDEKLTEDKIQEILRTDFMASNTKFGMDNIFAYVWESDYLAIMKSDLAYEFEIKISRSDFFHDKKKEYKHKLLESKHKKIVLEGYSPYEQLSPNYFYYVVPDGLVTEDEVPEYAGLIYITKKYQMYHCNIIKNAPKLHPEHFDYNETNLIGKFYWKWYNIKQQLKELPEIKRELRSYRKLCLELDNIISQYSGEINDLTKKLEKYERGTL